MSDIPTVLYIIVFTLTDNITIGIQHINHITVQVFDFILISRISEGGIPTYIRSIDIYT